MSPERQDDLSLFIDEPGRRRRLRHGNLDRWHFWTTSKKTTWVPIRSAGGRCSTRIHWTCFKRPLHRSRMCNRKTSLYNKCFLYRLVFYDKSCVIFLSVFSNCTFMGRLKMQNREIKKAKKDKGWKCSRPTEKRRTKFSNLYDVAKYSLWWNQSYERATGDHLYISSHTHKNKTLNNNVTKTPIEKMSIIVNLNVSNNIGN